MTAQEINAALRRVPTGVVYAAGLVPVAWLAWQTFAGALGPDPVKGIERSLGLWGLQMLLAGLCITPLRWATGVSLIRFRRAVGLIAFLYVALHLAVWVALDLQFRWAEIGTDLVKRPFIVVGFAAFLLLVPLAATSNTASVRWLGAAGWQRLHRLTYAAAVGGGVHFLWLVKAWPVQPVLYLVAIAMLLGVRAARSWQRRVA